MVTLVPGPAGEETPLPVVTRIRPGLSDIRPLPLIQMREDRPELRRQILAGYHHAAHTTPACRMPGSYGLFSGEL